jgi:hypothetical protein
VCSVDEAIVQIILEFSSKGKEEPETKKEIVQILLGICVGKINSS